MKEGLEEQFQRQVTELESAKESQAKASNPFMHFAYGAVVRYRRHAIVKSEKLFKARANLTPLWQQPAHFTLRSAEATLALSPYREPMDGHEMAEFVVTGVLPDRFAGEPIKD